MVTPERLELPYSDYAFNVRLEGGGDTGPIAYGVYSTLLLRNVNLKLGE